MILKTLKKKDIINSSSPPYFRWWDLWTSRNYVILLLKKKFLVHYWLIELFIYLFNQFAVYLRLKNLFSKFNQEADTVITEEEKEEDVFQ